MSDNPYSLAPDSVLHDKANAIATGLVRDNVLPQRIAFDPLTIIALLGLLVDVVRLLWECYHDRADEALQRVRRPHLTDGVRLRRLVRQKLREHPNLGVCISQVANLTYDAGGGVTLAEMEAMLRRAGAGEDVEHNE